MLDKDFFFKNLVTVCSLSTGYGEESRLHKILVPYLESKGFEVKTGAEVEPGNKISLDSIYATRIIDGQPAEIMFNAHMDVIQKKGDMPFRLQEKPLKEIAALCDGGIVKLVPNIRYDKNIAAYNARLRKIKAFKDAGIDHEIVKNGDFLYAVDSVIGGDDRCGIVAVMGLVEDYPYSCKVLFTTGEETGKGANNTWAGFYDGVKFSFTIDRKDYADFVKSINGRQLQSEEFRKFMVERGNKYKGDKVKVVEGAGADAYAIAKHVPEAFNCSAGYYEPHCKDEYINVDHLYSTYLWMLDTALEIKKQNIEPCPKPVVKESTYTQYCYTPYGEGGLYSNSNFSKKYLSSLPIILQTVYYFGDDVYISEINTNKEVPSGDCYKITQKFTLKKDCKVIECVIIRSMTTGLTYTIDKDDLDINKGDIKDISHSSELSSEETLAKIKKIVGQSVKLKKPKNGMSVDMF